MAQEQVSSILRALRILECFINNEKEWTLKALVEDLDMPQTTIFRQVSTLTDRGYLVQDPVRKSYHVGPRLLHLAGAVLNQSDLRTIARPELERLGTLVRETVNLSTMLDHDIFYLDKEETHRSVVCNTRIGSRAPAYATSSGKIMLAFSDSAVVDRFLEWMKNHARPLTHNTITDPEALRLQLITARLKGYAVDNEEIEEGLVCIGAPILDINRQPLAAVSVSAPEYRMRENMETFTQHVCQTAAAISILMGYRR